MGEGLQYNTGPRLLLQTIWSLHIIENSDINKRL